MFLRDVVKTVIIAVVVIAGQAGIAAGGESEKHKNPGQVIRMSGG
ncbi:hypothetical protein [Varunaivibrio sulfuroxidans]|uniref:Uncharacterized protein n=1 Tax=Varunaivibrio sulfuroxidans TaxID=1773489 RepID=A0A4R3J6C1_9PROT|nr:hypothetical protein [Varunaivibrio sulfuroxidans]TCS60917.1 hypothetical protein EDD55_10977 [Varunaivibrio sulfuroxidans]WES31675.1 hypothetical protein P3M64_04700 [Varunaivibrio sulfuroxidans]